ncbi:PDZ domain-containing protein [Microbacterium sp. cx-55]|uniref:YlbL family protein n=1 Tax=Microbacterium sp. cx-55 TaxID=2875948 RepID=UPI001CBEBA95|nr:S16 family serine protease [Microbacterium sp. cx-55]MBZ4485924.1 PDZ domain-containing protein [Microbacterium sp. cx-55]UGB34200.1 PDZ domain-containing protein [Microbacterium sp. cx-55]
MSLFEQHGTAVPEAPRRPMSRGAIAGIWALVVALLALLGMSFLPSPYVIERPGPVYNTLGDVQDADGADVPLISIPDAETYPTEGSLDLLTVQVVGTPEQRLSWLDVGLAWFDPTKAVVPIEQIYPTGQTTKERSVENATLMVDSQEDATAAALTHLGYDVGARLEVADVQAGSAADGTLEIGDIIVSAGGTALSDPQQLREIINAGAGAPVSLQIERDGAPQSIDVTPKEGTGEAAGVWQVGVSLQVDYQFPFDVTIQLDNVGGPSAGMMFALGMIDTLTPGELNGGAAVAGTGTIVADGTVGPIGGIRQKLWGAEGAGAEYFLAPSTNCDEVVGHIPDGLRVFSVSTLDDAVGVLDAISSGSDLDALPTCTAS